MKQKLFLLGAVVVVVLIAGAAFLHFHGSTTKKAVQLTGQVIAQQNAQDTERKNDINVILGGLDQYVTKNTGQLATQTAPGSAAQELNICGANCADATALSVVLSFYKPAAVTFHPYAQSLVVPNVNTVYIIPDATCNQGALATSTSRSAAILYALVTVGQQCMAM